MSSTLGGMQIFGEISAGGMGSVLLAKKLGPHGFEKLIAVKTIRADLADREDIRTLFLDEAQLAARIEHPAVTHIYDFGEDDGTLFLAMEYIQGISLEVLLEKLGALPAEVAARIGAIVCRGLHAAHETTGADGKRLGVVHRDVSPPNVMITFEGAVKILDFGIALMRNRRTPHTQVGRLRGKLAYMAPEQVLGGTIDRRTDIYGVANVLFELITGEKLRPEPTSGRRATVLERPLPRLRERGVPEQLEGIISRGLARDPEQRFVDARAMAVALETAALQLRGESLEDFAHRALAEEQAAHKKMIAALIGGAEVASKRSRGPTVVASGSTPAPTPPIEEPVHVSFQSPALAIERRAKMVVAICAAVLVVFVAASSLMSSSAASPEEVVPSRARVPEHEAPDMEAAPVVPSEAIAESPPGEEPRTRRAPEAKSHVRRPRAKKAADGPRELGYLTIGAHPYAVVLVDGRELGLTPLLKLPLETGAHRITLLDPASRSVRISETVEIHTDALTNRLYR